MSVKRDELISFLQKVYPFNFLSDQEINRIVDDSDLVFFEKEKIIYQEDSHPGYFYVVFEGRVELVKEKNQSLMSVNFLDEGNLFGLEIFGNQASRRTSARAVSRTLLVRISQDLIHEINSSNPAVCNHFQVLKYSYQNIPDFDVKDDVKEETIYYASRPHPFSLLLRILGFSGLMVLLLIFSILLNLAGILDHRFLFIQFFIELLVIGFWSIWLYIDWSKDYFIITGERVINVMKRLFSRDLKVETPLRTIKNINFEKNFFGRRFQFGDLFVKTYTGANHLKNVPDVEIVQSLLQFIWTKEIKNAIREEAKSFEKVLQENSSSIIFSEEILSNKNNSSVNTENFLAVYRTHWLVLIKKILIPSSLLICNLLLFLFFKSNDLDLLTGNLWFVIILAIQSGLIIWWLYQFFDWRNDRYIVTDEQIIDLYQRPFGLRNQRTAPLENIQSIRYEKKGLLGILLNFGTVFIRIGDEEFTFDNVPDPITVQEKIYSIFNIRIEEMDKKKLTDQQRRLAGWMETFHRMKEKGEGDLRNN